MPALTDGEDRISVLVKIHWEDVTVEGRGVGVCGECAILGFVDHERVAA